MKVGSPLAVEEAVESTAHPVPPRYRGLARFSACTQTLEMKHVRPKGGTTKTKGPRHPYKLESLSLTGFATRKHVRGASKEAGPVERQRS